MAKNNGCFSYFLSLIRAGVVQVHRDIDPAEVILKEKIAEGTNTIVFSGVFQGTDIAIKKFPMIATSEDIELKREFCGKAGLLR